MLRISHNLISLFFPPRCLACEKETLPVEAEHPARSPDPMETNDSFDFQSAFASHWCFECWKQITSDVGQKCCAQCGAAIRGHNPFESTCALCHDLDLRYSQCVSIGNYRGLLQNLVVRLKNQHDEQLAMQLGYVLGNQIRQADFFEDINLVLPVPTHWWTRLRRGFSGAEIIAESVAKSCDLPTARNVLRCLRSTQKQGTLSTPGRFKNVRRAFGIAKGTNVDGLTVLLIDDVMTSGATVSEVARELSRAGAAKVYVGVIARGARVS